MCDKTVEGKQSEDIRQGNLQIWINRRKRILVIEDILDSSLDAVQEIPIVSCPFYGEPLYMEPMALMFASTQYK